MGTPMGCKVKMEEKAKKWMGLGNGLFSSSASSPVASPPLRLK